MKKIWINILTVKQKCDLTKPSNAFIKKQELSGLGESFCEAGSLEPVLTYEPSEGFAPAGMQ